jgi:SAM-dependent methyltransferase
MGWVTENVPDEWSRRATSNAPDFEVADCGSEASHELRLQALLKLPLHVGDEVLDFGCGTGRLADFIPSGIGYVGLDWSATVIDEAHRRRPSRRFRVGSVADVVPSDWLIAQGPFNYAKGWSKEQTAEAVACMWRAARKGIGLTVLRSGSDDRLAYTPEELLDYLPDDDWTHAEFDRSYLPNDMCFRVIRGD